MAQKIRAIQESKIFDKEMRIRLLVVDAAFEIGANWICIDLCMHFEAPRTLGIGPRIT